MKPNKMATPRAQVRRLIKARRRMIRKITPHLRELEADIIARVEHEEAQFTDNLQDPVALEKLRRIK